MAWTGSAGPFAPAAQAMNADQLDIATGSITSGITSLSQSPGFAFFTATDPDPVGEGILVREGSGITAVKDLVFRDLGVDTFILSGNPLLEEAHRVAETVLPALGVTR